MKRIATGVAALALANAMVFAAGAQAAEAAAPELVVDRAPSAEAMVFDLFVMRPLGLVGTIAGAAVFIVALPFELINLQIADPARRLVGEPARFTFTRPLGDLD